MDRLCAHGLFGLCKERLNGSRLEMERACNLTEMDERRRAMRERTDQLGVDECKVDCIAFLVALWTVHRRRLDDARSDSASILDVFELGGEDGRVDKLWAAVDFEQLHDLIQPCSHATPQVFSTPRPRLHPRHRRLKRTHTSKL